MIVVGKETLLRRNHHWRYIIDKAKAKKDSMYGYKRADDFLKKGGMFKAMLKAVSYTHLTLPTILRV